MLEGPHSVDDERGAGRAPGCVLRGFTRWKCANGDTAVVIGSAPSVEIRPDCSRVVACGHRPRPPGLRQSKLRAAWARWPPHQRHRKSAMSSAARKELTEDGPVPILWSRLRAIPPLEAAMAMVRRGGVVNFFSGLPSETAA